MAGNSKAKPSFDDMIQADRQRRKNETLANSILGQKRSSSAPGVRPGSLASRVGVKKSGPPTAPRANINGQWGHDLHRLNNPQASRVSQLPARNVSSRTLKDNNRLYAALTSDATVGGLNDQLNVRGASGLSIRGAAGPFTVVASNFAPGTTAPDIQAAMEPVGGEITSCKLMSARPTVIAEIVFPEKAAADNIVSTFNNQKADGRVLHVYMKQGPSLPFSSPRQEPRPQSDIVTSRNFAPKAQGGRGDSQTGRRGHTGNRGSRQNNANPRLYSDAFMTD
ncbi:MAG: hypothetical protein M4579_002751 [Chaenotheca gracillima]|nr:MAG: hypothetical protein M4579_002751 [Chaenotheca gracillima]